MPPPVKHLNSSIERIEYLNQDSVFVLQTENQLLKNYQVLLKKEANGFSVVINFVPFKGFSSTMLDAIRLEAPIELTNGLDSYYLPENSLLFTSQNPSFGTGQYILSGTITQISTIQDISRLQPSYVRMVVPVLRGKADLDLIHGYYYDNETAKGNRSLIRIRIDEEEFEFFKVNGEREFLVIDSTKPTEFERFQKICYSILNAFGFISGTLHLDEAYFLCSNDNLFDLCHDIYYSTYRESIHTGYAVYTINPYSVYPITETTKEGIQKQSEEIKEWYEKIPELSPDIFSNICDFFFKKEAISRGAIILLQANNLALEVKGSAYSVALESITNQILKDNDVKFPKPVEDPIKAQQILNRFQNVISEEFPEETEPSITIRRILNNKISAFNSPTNADKLSRPFELFGYTLSQYELDVLKDRNKYQHGKLPAKSLEDKDVFQEVYFSCIVLHRLLVTLILKQAGFSGYIINYPKLHEHITNKKLNEERLYQI